MHLSQLYRTRYKQMLCVLGTGNGCTPTGDIAFCGAEVSVCVCVSLSVSGS